METEARPEELRHYVPTPGGTTVEVSRNSNGTSSTDYLLADHLGSTDAVLDGTGGFVLQASFDTFGKRRGSDWSAATPPEWTAIAQTTRVGYTGQEMLDNVGLVHLNGRVYDPAIGRFLSVDPLVGDLADSQSVNPYAYVGNRPLSYTDPSGYVPADVGGGGGGTTIGVGFPHNNGSPGTWKWWGNTFRSIGHLIGIGGSNVPPPPRTLPGVSAQRGAGLCGPGNTTPACAGMVVYASAATTESGVPSSTWAANPDSPAATAPSYPGEPGAQAAIAGLILAQDPNIPTAVKLCGPVVLAIGTGAVLWCVSNTPLCALIVSAADLGSLPISDVPYLGAVGRTAGAAAKEATHLEKELSIGSKVAKQMGSRGWTRAAIDEARVSGQQLRAINKANGNAATRYIHPESGQSVVIDDVTGEVIHVGGPGFKYGPVSGDLP